MASPAEFVAAEQKTDDFSNLSGTYNSTYVWFEEYPIIDGSNHMVAAMTVIQC